MKSDGILQAAVPGVEKVLAWERWPWLLAGFSTRQGGGSAAYGVGEQNLGWTAADDDAVVMTNRSRFMEAVAAASKAELVTMRQVHGNVVHVIESDHVALATADGKAVLEGDGMMTGVPGMLLGVQTADCVPVLLADTRNRAVAALHAGWRGTLARIVEQGAMAKRSRYGSRGDDLVAAIGPAIGPCCFEIGDEVRASFESQFAYGRMLFSNIGSQLHMDLMEANRRQLVEAGVAPERISLVGECSACTRLKDGRRKYFSHRAEHGMTGRMLSVIGVAGEN